MWFKYKHVYVLRDSNSILHPSALLPLGDYFIKKIDKYLLNMNKYLTYLSSVFFFWNRTKQNHSYIYVNLFISVFLSILYKIWHAIYTASYLVFYHPSSFFLSLLLSLLLSHWYYPFLLWKLVSFPPSIPPSLPSFFHFMIKWRLLFILHARYGSCLPSLFFFF